MARGVAVSCPPSQTLKDTHSHVPFLDPCFPSSQPFPPFLTSKQTKAAGALLLVN